MTQSTAVQIGIRSPRATDGAAMWRLAEESGSLDLNSAYSYLILCRHFSSTCLVAETENVLVGFLTGYLLPEQPDTVFVWQIAVAPQARRTGLGRRMVESLLDRLGPSGIRYLQATVTPSNEASRNLFRSIARNHGVGCEESEFFPAALFPDRGGGAHEPEMLLRLGPFAAARLEKQNDLKGGQQKERGA